jgi:hypothetical protein
VSALPTTDSIRKGAVGFILIVTAAAATTTITTTTTTEIIYELYYGGSINLNTSVTT